MVSHVRYSVLAIILFLSVLGHTNVQPEMETHKVVPKTKSLHGILLLIPGYNGSGEVMLDARWKAFAEKHPQYTPQVRTAPPSIAPKNALYSFHHLTQMCRK